MSIIMSTIRINYGVYKKGVESFNGKLEGEFDWDSDEDHKKIRQLIMDKHPGFRLHGYCIAPEVNDSSKLLGIRPDILIIDDPYFDYAFNVNNTIRDIGFKKGDKVSLKQLRYIGNCIRTGKEITKEDVLNIK